MPNLNLNSGFHYILIFWMDSATTDKACLSLLQNYFRTRSPVRYSWKDWSKPRPIALNHMPFQGWLVNMTHFDFKRNETTKVT